MPILGVIDSQKSGHLTNPSYDFIATATGNGSSGTLTFSSIPATYKTLIFRGSLMLSTGGSGLFLRFNGDSASNYSWHLYASTSSSSPRYTTGGSTGITFAYDAGAQGTPYPNNIYAEIADYASTTKNKTGRVNFSGNANGAGSVGDTIEIVSGAWYDTTAITSLSLVSPSANFNAGTSFSLYGIKG